MKTFTNRWILVTVTTVILAALWPVSMASASFMKPESSKDAALHEQILKLVETYAPEELSRWKEELNERSQLRSKLNDIKQSRNFQKKREQWEKQWQDKIDKGEMTREEANQMMEKKSKEYKEKRKQWKEEGKKLNEQLSQAIKKGDQDEIKKTLQAMFNRLSKANDMMKEKLKHFE